ncbi:hypothetical protein NKI51_11640 [Mesorhizobium australicum]|uniref:hypothetical protein n=1 Tax=Mesorhizobium australicum TaxID=536018 RepID=UPI003339D512
MKTPPIGRCNCGHHTYECDDLNARCDCGQGVVGSTAAQHWQQCPACLGTGKSLIWSRSDDCPVCRGSGWIVDAQCETARDEIATVAAAFLVAREWPPHPSKCVASKLGSTSVLRIHREGARPAEEVEALHDKVLEAMENLDDRLAALREGARIKATMAGLAAEDRARLAATKSAPK